MYICITATLDILPNADYIRSKFCHRIHANEYKSSFALPVFLLDIYEDTMRYLINQYASGMMNYFLVIFHKYQNDTELTFVLKTITF